MEPGKNEPSDKEDPLREYRVARSELLKAHTVALPIPREKTLEELKKEGITEKLSQSVARHFPKFRSVPKADPNTTLSFDERVAGGYSSAALAVMKEVEFAYQKAILDYEGSFPSLEELKTHGHRVIDNMTGLVTLQWKGVKLLTHDTLGHLTYLRPNVTEIPRQDFFDLCRILQKLELFPEVKKTDTDGHTFIKIGSKNIYPEKFESELLDHITLPVTITAMPCAPEEIDHRQTELLAWLNRILNKDLNKKTFSELSVIEAKTLT
jgi:hypothetical protein